MRTPLLKIRPLHGDVGPTIDTVFAGLSERSRYLRFHAPMPRLPGSVRRGLLHLYPGDRAALVAEVPVPSAPVPVGIARLGRTGLAEAEFAIAVVDDWHGLGIVLRENRHMLRLLERVFPDAERVGAGGVVRVDCPVGTRLVADAQRAPVLVE